jgi:hypothetical protein
MDNTTNLNITLDQTTETVCEVCNHKFFHQALYIRKVSGILTGTGQPSYIPIPVFACDKCDHVNKEFLPLEVRNLE